MHRPPQHFINRELSWLAFDRRVLEEAFDPAQPLLERVKFLAISASNLDEFFEIRVGGLLQQVEAGIEERGQDGLTPAEQLRAIAIEAHALVEDQNRCWNEVLRPRLADAGVHVRKLDELDRAERAALDRWAEASLLPVLTPITVDPAHPFPYVRNTALCIAALVVANDADGTPTRRLGVVTVPSVLPRLLRLPSEDREITYVFLADLVQALAPVLFHGLEVVEASSFRVTRNSNLYVDEEEADDLMSAVEAELHNRRKGEAVRLEVEQDASAELVGLLQRNLDLADEQVYRLDGPVNLGRILRLHLDTPRPDLKDEPWIPVERPSQEPGAFFDSIRRADVLLHHPYDSFSAVVDFVSMAARDPDVLAIKQTLYRTGDDSAVVKALIAAAEAGKEVTVVVELMARFDEEANIRWARRLEDAGVQVVYGLVGLKTHCKLSLLVRSEHGTLVRYAHLGTGNYHHSTARLYDDLGLLTARADVTADVAEVFNVLTSLSPAPRLRRILLAPTGMLEGMLALIRREAAHARAGRPARIVAKMNALLDADVIDALYDASAAGVRIDLVVRGICAIRPGIPGLSENVRVRSVVGRFLEHSRIYSFDNGGDPEVWLGSADWMPRNLRKRVEVLFPIDDPGIRGRLRREVLSLYLADNVKARELRADGSEFRVRPAEGEAPVNAQEAFMRIARGEVLDFPDAFADVPVAPSDRAAGPRTAETAVGGERRRALEPRRAPAAGPLRPGGPVAGNA
ncbi:polyphosphate kinase 1 [bacterium]|nr:polyphosphate kinase 1 [bacterium]